MIGKTIDKEIARLGKCGESCKNELEFWLALRDEMEHFERYFKK